MISLGCAMTCANAPVESPDLERPGKLEVAPSEQSDQRRPDQADVIPRTPRSPHHPPPASSPRCPTTAIAPRPPPDNSRLRAPSSQSSSRQSPERRSACLALASRPSLQSAHGSASKPRPSTPIPIAKTASVGPRAQSSHPCLPSPPPSRTPLPQSPPSVQCHTPPVAV